jgi:hypothetical protein
MVGQNGIDIVTNASGIWVVNSNLVTFESQAGIFAGPLNGSSGRPAFRQLGWSDLSSLGMLTGEILMGVNGSAPVPTRLIPGANTVFTYGAGTLQIDFMDVDTLGTVTSIDVTVPTNVLSVSGGPITTNGTFALSLVSQAANKIFASPSGSSGLPVFRSLTLADMPALVAGQIYMAGSIFNVTAGTGIDIVASGGLLTFSNLMTGTVSSVGLSLPSSIFSVTGSPVTTTGTLTATLASQLANTFLAAPAGAAGAPSFRTMTIADLPALSDGQLYIGDSMNGIQAAGLTAGSGITITPGMGSITISSTQSIASVGLSLPPSIFSVSGSPLTASGTLSATLVSQSADLVFASPSGSSGTPSFRALATSDIATGTLPVARGGTNLATLTGNRIMLSSASGLLESTALLNGQLLIGSTGSAPVGANLVAGTGISITNGAGSITVSSTGVTSVTMTVPSIFSVAGSPITTTGTLAVSLVSQTANRIWASPSGASGTPTFRALVTADIPSLDTGKLTTGTLAVARGGTNSATALSSNRIMVSSGGAIVEGAALTNGQLLIGSTSAAPVAATLTAGAGISITNGAGSITVSSTGVTSVAMTVPSGIFSVAGSPITATGTLAVSLAAQSANLVFASPSGSSGTPIFRSLTAADLPQKQNLVATTAPGVTADGAAGYSLNSIWIDTVLKKQYVCLDATNGAAIWKETTVSSSGSGSTCAEVSETASTTRSSSSYGAMANMTLTLSSGSYMFTFSASGKTSSNSATMQYAIYNDATMVGHSRRSFSPGSVNSEGALHTQAKITVNGSNVVTVQYLQSAGTATVYERSFTACSCG